MDEGGGGLVCGQNSYHVAIFHDFIYFDMQHDHVLKKLNFDLLTLMGGRGLRAKYLLPCWYISCLHLI